jgi:hypothetical protein
MNCQDVEQILRELARGDAGADQAVRAHLSQCLRCSQRLDDEEKLTVGLAAWAEASSAEQAPPRLEQKLIEAFRQNSAPARRSRRWIPVVAAGSIAAAALLVKLLTPAAPPIAQAPPAPRVEAVETVSATPVIVPEPPPKIRPARRVVRRARPTPPAQAQLDFLPVAQGDGWTPLDGGRLVRVGLPRTALRVFGLPMDEERAQEQVQADVMLSNDGLLRAIRFVK